MIEKRRLLAQTTVKTEMADTKLKIIAWSADSFLQR